MQEGIKPKLNSHEIQTQAHGQWTSILSHLAIQVPSNPKRHGPCPACGGKDRFRFDNKDGRGTWYCNRCETHSGDGLRLVMKVRRCSFREALELVAGFLGLTAIDTRKAATPKAKTRLTPPDGMLGQDVFRYEDSSGRPVLFVKRVALSAGAKRFEQWGPTADGQGWQSNTENALKPRPLYRLPQILLSQADDRIVIHEGEKAVHASINAALPGIHITTVGGANNP